MADLAIPNLPTRSFDASADFYAKLGFTPTFKDSYRMILTRGDLRLEFFHHPENDPATSGFSCCLRLDDVDAFYAVCLAAGLPVSRTGAPRLHEPKLEPSGLRIGALIDPEGTLLRLIQNPDVRR